MLFTKSTFQKILILGFVLLLVSCGGGSGGTTPPPAEDTIAPVVVATNPTSEQTSVKVITFIEVTFSEDIPNVGTNQVSIYPFGSDGVVSTTRLALKANTFSYDNTTKTLTIKPEVDFQIATKYRVLISDIKDNNGNVMAGECQWDFGTTGYPTFGVGKTGVCTSDPDPVAPGKPENVNIVAGDGSVTVNWQAPLSGGAVTHYKVEKSVDKQAFEDVNLNTPSTTFSLVDPAQNGLSHVYRISAVNTIGASSPVLSNSVTPTKLIITKPGAPQNVTATAGDNTATVTWQAPITGSLPTHYKVDKSINNQGFVLLKDMIPNNNFSLPDGAALNGQNLIYRVTAINSAGPSIEVTSNVVRPQRVAGVPGSPTDVTATGVDATTVTISWVAPTSVDSPTYYTIDKSTDNQATYTTVNANVSAATTSINDTSAQIGLNHIYRIIAGNDVGVSAPAFSNNVVPAPKLIEPISELTSSLPGQGYRFGSSVAISPNGLALAVGEPMATATGLANEGKVQIYTKSGTSWVFSQTLVSKAPSGQNLFGSSLEFTPDGTGLAVGDSSNVEFFFASGNSWGGVITSGIVLTTPATINSLSFGSFLSFSPDGSTLAVSQSSNLISSSSVNGSVYLFLKTGGSWSNTPTTGPVLVSQVSVSGAAFGSSTAFSPDSNALAVGESSGNFAGNSYAGKVQLFTKSGATWLNTPTTGSVLSAVTPGVRFYFGSLVTFSPDGVTLAVGSNIPNSISESKNAQLFIRSGSSWATSPTIGPTLPVPNRSGFAMAFSPDNRKLIIGGISATSVIFNKIISWNNLPESGFTLNSSSSSEMVFIPDGSSLLIGGEFVRPTGSTVQSGLVKIFDASQF